MKCPVCRIEFEPIRKIQKRCSRKCTDAYIKFFNGIAHREGKGAAQKAAKEKYGQP